MADDIKPHESVWVQHPDSPDAPVLISERALQKHLDRGFVEMTDRPRVRDAAQVAIFGPAPTPAETKPPAPAGGKTSGGTNPAGTPEG